MIASILAIVMVVLGLGLVIFIHEAGHFIMAKKNGVRVEIFSLGFGPAIWSFRRGETEYRVSWVPLGGYVKMTGETLGDERKGEPFELTSKTPWQRFQIFVAGAVMNLLIAFPIAILAYLVGLYEVSTEVGNPGTAEAAAGIRPGDVILEAGGRKIDNMNQYRIEMIRRFSGTRVPVKVERQEEGGKVVKEFVVEAMGSSYHAHTRAPFLMVDNVPEDSPAAKAGLRGYDEVIEVDGKRIHSAEPLDAALRNGVGKDVRLKVRRRDLGWNVTEHGLEPLRPEPRAFFVIPDDDHLKECVIGGVAAGMPATGKLNKEDVIVKIATADGKEHPIASWQDMKDVVEANGARPLEFHLKGGGPPVKIVPTINDRGKGSIGVGYKPTSTFAKVVEGSFHHQAGLRSGDVINAINGVPGSGLTWIGDRAKNIPSLMGFRGNEAAKVEVSVQREGSKDLVKVVLEAKRVEEGDLKKLGFEATEDGRLAMRMTTAKRRRPFGDAVGAGLHLPVDITIMTVEVLGKLINRQEPLTGLSGPVGIAHASYQLALQSVGNFLWLLCLITVNLGVFNLLPIPVLDGGHNVLLLIEVLRKKFGKPPPSERFVATFQYVGLILILFLVILVTFNDVMRFRG